MALHLIIENETALPDGGPLSVSVPDKRGIDIGRDRYLDWSLPDPTRAISGKHCEIRYRDGGFWLHDVSRNGTFLNRSDQRLQEPYRLRDGDRIEIGRYIIAVAIDREGAEAAASSPMVAAPAAPSQYWDEVADAAAPIARRDLSPERAKAPVRADFSDWAVDVPEPPPLGADDGGFAPAGRPMGFGQGGRPLVGADWAGGSAGAPPAMPEPRRPVDWGAPAPAPPPEAAPTGRPLPEADAAPWAMPSVPPPVAAPSREARPLSETSAPPASDNPWGTPSLMVASGPPVAPPQTPVAPPPPAASAPALPEPPPPGPSSGAADLARRFAAGAGISPEVLQGRDAGDLAEEAGALLRLAAEHLKQLLSARAETKRIARSGRQTTIQATDNNPLKFSPSVEDALAIMLGRRSRGYLDARAALDEGYRDLKTHQAKTYSAMQNALRLLTENLDPATIEAAAGHDKGLGGMLGSKKARLWDQYVTRWDTMASPHENGMVDAFMVYFAECYDGGPGEPTPGGRS